MPRNEKDRLETPPETCTWGRRRANAPHGFDEIDAVIVVFLDAGRHREYVGIEDDVLGREADRLGQHMIGARADGDLALERVGLALFVERHDHDGGAVAAHGAGELDEFLLAFLERDGIHDGLALDAFEPGLDDVEFRRIHHDRNPGDVGLGGDEMQEIHHRLGGIDEALVHVDVDDLGAVGDLFARHVEAGGSVSRLDQLAETRRAGDIGAFADIDEAQCPWSA